MIHIELAFQLAPGNSREFKRTTASTGRLDTTTVERRLAAGEADRSASSPHSHARAPVAAVVRPLVQNGREPYANYRGHSRLPAGSWRLDVSDWLGTPC